MQVKLIQILTAFIGSLGFSIIFNIRGKKLVLAAFGGVISWSTYLAFETIVPSEAGRYVIATAVLTFYAEKMARKSKCPATIYQVAGAIPLIPGGALYYTINYAMIGQWQLFSQKALSTLLLMVAIAVGILLAMTILHIIRCFSPKKTLN